MGDGVPNFSKPRRKFDFLGSVTLTDVLKMNDDLTILISKYIHHVV